MCFSGFPSVDVLKKSISAAFHANDYELHRVWHFSRNSKKNTWKLILVVSFPYVSNTDCSLQYCGVIPFPCGQKVFVKIL